MTDVAPEDRTTGKAIVDEWRKQCLARGWIVDRDLPWHLVFQPLAELIDEALLDAWSRKTQFVKSREESRRPSLGR